MLWPMLYRGSSVPAATPLEAALHFGILDVVDMKIIYLASPQPNHDS